MGNDLCFQNPCSPQVKDALSRELALRVAPWEAKEAIAKAIFFGWPFCWLPNTPKLEDKTAETIAHFRAYLEDLAAVDYDLVL